MKYALVVESNAMTCNSTSSILASLGYLVTPTFNQRKALHAVQMIQFDLIVTWTVVNAGDRRSLTGELKRYSPDAVLLLVTDTNSGPSANGNMEGVDAILHRPFTAQDVQDALTSSADGAAIHPAALQAQRERRQRPT